MFNIEYGTLADGDKDQHEDFDQKLHFFDEAAEAMIKKVKQAIAHGEGCRVFFLYNSRWL